MADTGASAQQPGGQDRYVTAGRRALPARLRITGLLVLLLTSVLAAVIVVTRDVEMRAVDADAVASIEQEAEEFADFAEIGRNPETSAAFTTAAELLDVHLRRQRTDQLEVLAGVTGPDATTVQRQGFRRPSEALSDEVVAAIVADPAAEGRAETTWGELRWARVDIDAGPATTAPDGYFVVGELVGLARAEVDGAARNLALVSLAGLLLAALASWLLAGQILEPVRLVRQAAAEIGEQDLSRRIPVRGNDDIAALAEQFNAMLDRLQQAFVTQREFLDDASHELRTPITILRGNLELMSDDPTERAEGVRLCLDELDRMSRMVEDLLMLAKAERPDFVRPAPVDLADLTCDIDAKIRTLGERRWLLDAIGEGEVHVDAQRITQAVVQLAQNAVQHTTCGAEIRLGSALFHGTASLWITDSGPGVDPRDAEHLFERFSRGAAGAALDRPGAGLGLAIVAAIARAHHGRTRLLSTPGEGATFGVEVPAARAAVPRKAPAPAVEAAVT